GVRFHQLHRLLSESYEIGRLEFVFFAALLDAGEIENILNKRGEPAAFLDDEVKIFVLFWRLGNFSTLQGFRHKPDGSERGAQFVRNAGNKIAFQLAELQLTVKGPPGCGQSNQGRSG